jgi:dolichol-phosphate mannosyltransferase
VVGVTRERPDLSVVVPTYNERERLGELARALFTACADAGIALELVVVDDNSPDGTGALADELATRHRVKVVHRAGKLGLGTAVMAGFGVASCDVLGVMDADLSHPPSLVPKMLAVLERTGADVVVASRYIPGGATANWPLKRRVLSRLGCLLARPLLPIRDPASGFFLVRRAVVDGVVIKAGGFKIGLELMMRGRPRKFVEVPYRFADREQGESKMGRKEAVGYLVQLKDLYFVPRPPRAPEYERLTADDVERIVSDDRRRRHTDE